jgi:hypothetical protein
LGFGYGLLRADAPDDAKRKAAQNAILELSQNLDAKDVSERAALIVKDHASEDISSVFRRKNAGGLGIGQAVEAGHQDSIERLVMDFSRKKNTTEAELERYQTEYLRVAKVLQTMAQLAPHRATERVRKDAKLYKEWLDVAAEFKEGTAGFRTAVEEKDPKKVRLAAGKMLDTCCHCHGLADF